MADDDTVRRKSVFNHNQIIIFVVSEGASSKKTLTR
jgi:hypothetical protein